MLYKTPVNLLLLATGLLPSALAVTLKARDILDGHCIKFPNDVAGGCQLNSDGRIFSCTYGSCIGDDGQPIPEPCNFNTDNFQAYCPSVRPPPPESA